MKHRRFVPFTPENIQIRCLCYVRGCGVKHPVTEDALYGFMIVDYVTSVLVRGRYWFINCSFADACRNYFGREGKKTALQNPVLGEDFTQLPAPDNHVQDFDDDEELTAFARDLLQERQRIVLRMSRKGYETAHIARGLGISDKSVEQAVWAVQFQFKSWQTTEERKYGN